MLRRSTAERCRVERPPVTPASRCERAPLRARAVSPAGITTQSWISGFRVQLWPEAGMVHPCEAVPAGLTLRQTDTQGVSQPTHSQEEAATSARGQKTDESGLRPQLCFFLTAELGFCIKPQPPTTNAVQWGFHRAGTRHCA